MAKTKNIAGNKFLFTGKLTEFTREDAEAHVEAEGGKVLSGVSSKLNYLVVGEDAGSKLAKAEALGSVTILHEKEFLKMMNSGKKSSVKAAPNNANTKESTKPAAAKTTANKVSSDKAYEEVQIGKQIWMAKNLDVTHFRNGDPILEARTSKEWLAAFKKRQPAYCNYNNIIDFGNDYGRIYNCFAINDSRGLAPLEWNVPSLEDWTQLQDFIGLDSAKKIKASFGWDDNKNGLKKSLFNALPGVKRCDDGSFGGNGFSASWWCNGSVWFPDQLWVLHLDNEDKELTHYNPDEKEGYCIRCVKKNK